jgi:hypothetical protein
MNYLAGRLLKCLSEEQAFWVFAMLIETILPIDYYTQMIGIQVDVKVFKNFIAVYLPEIDKKFKSLNYDPLFFSLTWFVCLYTDKLKENVNIFLFFIITI